MSRWSSPDLLLWIIWFFLGKIIYLINLIMFVYGFMAYWIHLHAYVNYLKSDWICMLEYKDKNLHLFMSCLLLANQQFKIVVPILKLMLELIWSSSLSGAHIYCDIIKIYENRLTVMASHIVSIIIIHNRQIFCYAKLKILIMLSGM